MTADGDVTVTTLTLSLLSLSALIYSQEEPGTCRTAGQTPMIPAGSPRRELRRRREPSTGPDIPNPTAKSQMVKGLGGRWPGGGGVEFFELALFSNHQKQHKTDSHVGVFTKFPNN